MGVRRRVSLGCGGHFLVAMTLALTVLATMSRRVARVGRTADYLNEGCAVTAILAGVVTLAATWRGLA
jgi:hypothetical protein